MGEAGRMCGGLGSDQSEPPFPRGRQGSGIPGSRPPTPVSASASSRSFSCRVVAPVPVGAARTCVSLPCTGALPASPQSPAEQACWGDGGASTRALLLGLELEILTGVTPNPSPAVARWLPHRAGTHSLQPRGLGLAEWGPREGAGLSPCPSTREREPH